MTLHYATVSSQQRVSLALLPSQGTVANLQLEENRDQMQLFVDIAKYMSQHTSGKRSSDFTTDAPDAKKRKTTSAPSTAAASPAPALNLTTTLNPKDASNVLYSVPETSFAVPQRKKMTAQLAGDPQRLEEGAVRIVHEGSGINLAVPFSKIGR